MEIGRRRTVSRAGLLLGIVMAGALVVGMVGPSSSPTDFRPVGPPLPLPASQLASVGSDEFAQMLAGLEGRPVVVNVWASWCAPCRAEMPLLQRASAEFDGEVAFVGVASRDSRSAAAAFLDEVGIAYASVFDATGEVREALGLVGFPTTYVFDRSGTLVNTIVGGVTEPQLAAQLRDVLH